MMNNPLAVNCAVSSMIAPKSNGTAIKAALMRITVT